MKKMNMEKQAEKKAQEKFNHAHKLMKKKAWAEAVEVFTTAISIRPEPRFHFYRGTCYKHLRDYDRAVLDYLQAITEEPHPYYILHRGICFRVRANEHADPSDRDKDLNFSIRDFNLALQEMNKKSAEIKRTGDHINTNFLLYLNRGITHLEMKQKEKAIEDFTCAIDTMIAYKPSNKQLFKPYFFRGNTLREIGKLELSIEDLTKAAELDTRHSAVQNNLGLSLYELGKFDSAVARYTTAVEIDPDMAPYYNNRGLAYYRLKDYEKSLEDFSEAIAKDENDGNFYFNRGNTFLAMRKYNEALNDFDAAIGRVNADHKYYHCKGMAYQEMKDVHHAIKMFKKALEINPDYIQSLYHLGLMYHANGQPFEAKRCFERVLSMRSDRRAYESKGLVNQDLLYYDLAVEDFSAAIRLAPKYPLNYFHRGRSLLWLGRYKEAISDFNEAFALGCEDAKIYNARAMAQKYLGCHKEAIEDLQKSIELDGNNIEYLFNRSQCYFDLKKYKSAIRDLDQAIDQLKHSEKKDKMHQPEAKLYYLRGLAKFELERFKDCIKDLKIALRTKPNSSFAHDCYYHIGISYCRISNHENAIPSFTRAIELHTMSDNRNNMSSIATYYHERAKTYQHLMQYEDSIKDFTQVIAMEPKNAYAYFRRAFSYKVLGMFDEAAEDFEKAKALQPDNPNLIVNYKKIYDIAYIQLE
jgi:tetratricopeptide (TPR) repeat protein